MNVPAFNDHYALLALFLSPWKDERTVHRLSDSIRKGRVDWGGLLYMANLHYCAPLWFVSLRKDGLLPLLPPELQIYLKHLHEANVERQTEFRNAAIELVSSLNDREVPVILLKGGATLCDDLYHDPGARMMGDLDLLVNAHHVEQAKMTLLRKGYEEQENCFGNSAGFFNSNVPHHLPRFVKPGTCVVAEIHFQTAQGQAGRVLPTDVSWRNTKTIAWEGLHPFVLMPTQRLLHNTVHALVPQEAYTTSIVSLSQITEFAYLVRRYRSAIDWREWLARGADHGLGRQFRCYLTVANRLMGMPFPEHVARLIFPGLPVARICAAGNNRASYLSGRESSLETLPMRLGNIAIRIYIRLFKRLHRPAWVWQNLCYRQGIGSLPVRLCCLVVLIIKGFNFKNPFGIRTMPEKLKRIKFLMKKPMPQ